MDNDYTVFGFYLLLERTEHAVEMLLQAGFRNPTISALCPDNQQSRNFAEKLHTRPPRGTVDSRSATAPLEGDLGLTPTRGPVRGALAEALSEIGLSADWLGGKRVVDGEFLLSVQCESGDAADRAMAVLETTGADSVQPVRELPVNQIQR